MSETVCDVRYPKNDALACLKPHGHDGEHATCLGVHPATDEYPEEAEWDTWEEEGEEPEAPPIPKYDLDIVTPPILAPGEVVRIMVRPAGTEEPVAEVDIAIEMFAVLFPGLVRATPMPEGGIIRP